MPMSQGGQTNTTNPTSMLAPTAASTLFFADVQITEEYNTDNQSQTSYALSLGEKEDDLQLRLPRLFNVAQGSSTFECPALSDGPFKVPIPRVRGTNMVSLICGHIYVLFKNAI